MLAPVPSKRGYEKWGFWIREAILLPNSYAAACSVEAQV